MICCPDVWRPMEQLLPLTATIGVKATGNAGEESAK